MPDTIVAMIQGASSDESVKDTQQIEGEVIREWQESKGFHQGPFVQSTMKLTQEASWFWFHAVWLLIKEDFSKVFWPLSFDLLCSLPFA